MSWTHEEFRHVRLGDRRLDRRLCEVVDALSRAPEASIPEALNDPAAVKATYRLIENEHVAAAEIWRAHAQATIERMLPGEPVLCIQDTTWLDFTTRPGMSGLGYHQHPKVQGLFLHSALAVTSQGVPLGIVDHKMWRRDNERFDEHRGHKCDKYPLEEKESFRWLETLTHLSATIPLNVPSVHIADREADIYHLLALLRRRGDHLLVRSEHDRCIIDDHCQHLSQLRARSCILGNIEVKIGHSNGRSARTASVTLMSAQAVLKPRKGSDLPPVPINVIWAEELCPPLGTKPIKWCLLTSLQCDSFDNAAQAVRYYSHRWLIERYHYVLKSGCKVEELQLETAERFERALAMYVVIAWRLLWLTYQSRKTPQMSCVTALSYDEWITLYQLTLKTTTPPGKPPTLDEVVRWLARMGGHLGKASPGVKVLWRGYRRLVSMVETKQALQQLYDFVPKSLNAGKG